MKKLFAIAVLVLVLVLVLQAVSFACTPPPPPPPCEPADCSAGFWKNHTEIWDGEGTLWLDILKAKGNDPLRAERGWVVSELNMLYPDASCD